MSESKTVTFRDQTTGRISDLLMDEGQPCAQSQNLLTYLAGALLNYRDEGIEFAPSILFCNNIADVLQSFPGGVTHLIGQVPLDASSGPRILKDCAPLSSGNWFIYIERIDGQNVRYGVFTYFRLPTAIPLHEGITIAQNIFAVLIRKISANTIEMRGAKGHTLSLIFSTVRESHNQKAPIDKFAHACYGSLPSSEVRNAFSIYFLRFLTEALTSSHGTILICANNINLAAIPEMQDAVHVNPQLDFYTAFSEYQTHNSAESILNLQRCEDLLHGFLRCDGLVVFNTDGQVVAYRVFYKSVNAPAAPFPTVVGGARRRAFEGLKALVGSHLISVLFRSQDGLTLYHGDNND